MLTNKVINEKLKQFFNGGISIPIEFVAQYEQELAAITQLSERIGTQGSEQDYEQAVTYFIILMSRAHAQIAERNEAAMQPSNA